MNTAPGNEPTIPNLEKPTSEQWRLLIAELVVAMYKLAGPTPPWLPEFPDFDFRVEKVEAEIERLKTCTPEYSPTVAVPLLRAADDNESPNSSG